MNAPPPPLSPETFRDVADYVRKLESEVDGLEREIALKEARAERLRALHEWIAGSDVDDDSEDQGDDAEGDGGKGHHEEEVEVNVKENGQAVSSGGAASTSASEEEEIDENDLEEIGGDDAATDGEENGNKRLPRKKIKRRSPLPHFYDWRLVFPELKVLLERLPAVLAEATEMERKMRFYPWPESNLYNRSDQSGDWKVVPLLYTFPATREKAMTWVEANCVQCPETTRLLRAIPGIRTALFSRMGPNTRLSSHRGWADLANHVLRCHLTLRLPKEPPRSCSVWVEGQVRHHAVGDIIVFDDSHEHKAFNASLTEDRIVLIFDIMRPSGIQGGSAIAGHTDQLDGFINDYERILKTFST